MVGGLKDMPLESDCVQVHSLAVGHKVNDLPLCDVGALEPPHRVLKRSKRIHVLGVLSAAPLQSKCSVRIRYDDDDGNNTKDS